MPGSSDGGKRKPSKGRLLANPLWLISLASVVLALAGYAIRKDLTLTRLQFKNASENFYTPLNIYPAVDSILDKLAEHGWEYRTVDPVSFRPSPALEYVRGEIKPQLPNSAQHLKLWDLLDEGFMTGQEALVNSSLATFGKSIFMTDPKNQEGLADYLSSRVVPQLYQLVARRDYGAARRLVVSANIWIDACKPTHTLATDSPQLQVYFNLFRRLDAVFDDPAVLYGGKLEGQRVLEYLMFDKKMPPAMLEFLNKSDSDEIQAWGRYIAAAAELKALHYGIAAHAFELAAGTSHNPKLRELALLGSIRSAFWAARAGEIEKDAAIAGIGHDMAEFKTERYHDDAVFYLKTLASDKPASEASEESQ